MMFKHFLNFTIGLFLLPTLTGNAQCPPEWQKFNLGNQRLASIYSINDTIAYTGSLFKTIDGGQTWTNQISQSDFAMALHFHNKDTGWKAGSKTYGNIGFTKDSGKNWSNQYRSDQIQEAIIYAIHFFDRSNGWAAGDPGILHTANGGKSWHKQGQELDENLLYGIYATSSKAVWAVGKGGLIIHSTDSGANWTRQSSRTNAILQDIQFVNEQQGWIAGNPGTILHTRDGGETWVKQATPTNKALQALHFTDTNRGWAVGESGTLLHTFNGGKTWYKKFIPTSKNLSSIHFHKPGRGWVSSWNGIVLRYTAKAPQPSFEYSVQDTAVHFYNTSLKNSAFRWNFGDGSKTLAKNPSHSYSKKGVYEACLIAQSACNVDTFCDSIRIEQSLNTYSSDKGVTLSTNPNPVNEKITFEYHLAQPKKVTLTLFNAQGQKLQTYHWGHQSAGKHSQDIRFQDWSDGLYFYRFQAGEKTEGGRLINH